MGLSYRADISQRGGEGFTHPSTNLQLPFWDCPYEGGGGRKFLFTKFSFGLASAYYSLNFHRCFLTFSPI